MNGKGRPEKLTEDLKQWIVTHQQGRKKKLKATAIQADIRNLIEAQLQKENEKRELPWNKALLQSEVDSWVPGISTIQKYIKPLNEKLDAPPSEVDNPWHLGTLKKYALPAEAIPIILVVQDFALKQDVLKQPYLLSIRQVIWIARLYKTVDAILDGDATLVDFKNKKGKGGRVIEKLLRIFLSSQAYAEGERLCELADIPFNSFTMDRMIANGSFLRIKGKTVIGNIGDTAITDTFGNFEDVEKDLANSAFENLLKANKPKGG